MRRLVDAMIRGEAPQAPVAQLIGMKLVAIAEGEATFELDAGPEHANPMGTLHGGILCDLADGAMGVAFVSTLEQGESFTTLELKMNYVRPFRTGLLRATGRLIDRGRTVGVVECEIKDDEGRLVAYGTSTCMVLRGEQAKGR